jgi:hypothetical protein
MLPKTFNHVLFFMLILTLTLHQQAVADIDDTFAEQTQQLSSLSSEIKKNVLPLLSLIREMEKHQTIVDIELVKITKTTANVHDADNADATIRYTAQMHGEYELVDQRDQWYQILLPDGRSGWIHEDDVQIITSTVAESKTGSVSQDQQRKMLALMAGWMDDIRVQHRQATAILDSLQYLYNGLALTEKQKHYSAYEQALAAGNQIQKNHTYADKFFQPYAEQIVAIAASPTSAERRPFSGHAGINLGRSQYKFDKKEESSARNINLGGSMPLNDRSNVSFGYNSRKEVLITPFASNDLFVGYSNRFANGLNLNSRLSYNSYNDENSDLNNFGSIGARANATYPLSDSNQLFGSYQLVSKSYSEDKDNNYASNQFNVGSRMKRSSTSELTANVRGIVQASDISYMSFNQWTPRLRYTKKLPNRRSFGAIADVDLMAYDKEAKNNNYSRETIKLRWTTRSKRKSRTKNTKFIAKQFSNNERFNYLKLGGDIRWQSGVRGFGKSTSTTVYGLVTYFSDENAPQSDYLDLRVDRSKTFDEWFINVNSYTRLWGNASAARNVDHILNLYSKVGLVFPTVDLGPLELSKLKFGPIIGAHIQFNKDEHFIMNDGNSIRIGVGLQSYFNISKLAGHFSYTLERSQVYGNAIEVDVNSGQIEYGQLVKRKPLTIQWNLGARAPVTQDLDFQIDMSFFNINLDLDAETSINPIESRSKFMLLGGLAWRFDFIQVYDNVTGQFSSREGR